MKKARSADCARLEEILQKDGSSTVILYGRQGLDHKGLVRDFLDDRKYLYYHAVHASETEQQILLCDTAKRFDPDVSFSEQSYEEVFSMIGKIEAEPFIFVIEDVEHLIRKDGGFAKALAEFQKTYHEKKCMVLLISSSIVWVEQTMRTHLPPEVKIDEMIRRKELTFLDMVRAFESYSVRDCVRAYGIIGGVPAYMHAWDSSQSVKKNVCRLILSEDGVLYREAERYLSSELRELSVYYTILGAIAKTGARKLNDLYNETGFSRAKISVYMKHMAAFEVIEKVYPFETGGYENAQKGVYRIKNTFLNFWFHFIYPHLSELSMMQPEAFYDTYIAPGMDMYLNRYFVDVCKEYLNLLDQVGQLPIKIKKMGTWIGKDGVIDIIAQDEARNRIVGMCKWSEKVMTYEMCKQLQGTMKQAVVKAKCIFLFSAGIFDGILTQKAVNDPSLVLVDMNRL